MEVEMKHVLSVSPWCTHEDGATFLAPATFCLHANKTLLECQASSRLY